MSLVKAPSHKILVSACLLGKPVRYNGLTKPLQHELLEKWKQEERIISVCPELMAGFSVPRLPAEIAGKHSGKNVLEGSAHVIELNGKNVTALFVEGAKAVLALAQQNNCKYALLIDGSPSCGSNYIYDGSFSSQKHAGIGVTTALLRDNGIEVFQKIKSKL